MSTRGFIRCPDRRILSVVKSEYVEFILAAGCRCRPDFSYFILELIDGTLLPCLCVQLLNSICCICAQSYICFKMCGR